VRDLVAAQLKARSVMNTESTRASGSNGVRRSILELAPLELDCMNALWAAGEATVRDIRDRLAPFRPRAYTTIMTIMDRLAHKGVVSRRKSGRAYVYSANLTTEQARSHAVEQLLQGFFGGSTEALRRHLEGGGVLTLSHPARSPQLSTELEDRHVSPQASSPASDAETTHASLIDESLL
jgi:BlaI family transcriptional regulator, penicillinase repressor